MKRLALALALCLFSLPALAVTKRATCAVGTSLTYGYTFDATPYPARAATLLGTPVVNLGVGSDRMANIRSRWRTYCKPFPYKRLLLEGGTNDLDFDGTSGDDLWATVEAFIEEAEAAGQEVVLILIPPRDGSGGWSEETERVSFNDNALSYAATHPSLIVVDSNAVLGNGATPPALQTSPVNFDWGDHLHLSADGMQALAQGVIDAL